MSSLQEVCDRLHVKRDTVRGWLKTLLPASHRPGRSITPGEELAIWAINYTLDLGWDIRTLKPYAATLFEVCADPPLSKLPHPSLGCFPPTEVAFFCRERHPSDPLIDIPIARLANMLLMAQQYKPGSIWLEKGNKAERNAYVRSLCAEHRVRPSEPVPIPSPEPDYDLEIEG